MEIKKITQEEKELEREERDRQYKKEVEEERQEKLNDMKENPVKYMAMAGIKKMFLTATLKEIKLPPKKVKIAKQFLENKDGLFLTGKVGTGKTYLACAIGRELIMEGNKILFKTIPSLFQDIRATFGKTNKEDESHIINKYSCIPYLILDDLGAEKMSDFSLDRLYLIIDGRYADELPTIITSNLSLKDIREKIHDRISSRIAGSCRTIQMPEVDLRLTNRRNT